MWRRVDGLGSTWPLGSRWDAKTSIAGEASKPADITCAVDAADSSAERPVKAGGSPLLRPIGIDHCRNFTTRKSKVYFWLFVAERLIAVPGSLEVRLFDCCAKFRDESLHLNHLIYNIGISITARPANGDIGLDAQAQIRTRSPLKASKTASC